MSSFWKGILCLGFILSFHDTFGMTAAEKSQICRILLNGTGGVPYHPTASGDILSTFNAAVLSQLILNDENFELKPGLLSDYTFDRKTNRYILTLKAEVRFHNGRLATAQDLEFSLVRGFFSPQRSFYNIYLNNIRGIDDVKAGEKFRSGRIAGVQILDDRRVAVQLAHPNPAFLHSLNNPFFGLIPIEELQDDYLTWKRIPIGAGPYRVKEPGFQNGKVTLELVDPSLNAPKIVELHTEFSDSTRYDLALSPPKAMDLKEFHPWMTPKPSNVKTLFFSNLHPLGQNKNFRLAVQRLVNRTALVKDHADVFASFEILPKHFYGRTGMTDPHNRAEAAKLLAAVPKDELSKPLRIPVFVSGNQIPDRMKVFVDRLTEQFADLGIKTEFYPSTEKFLTEATARKSPFHFQGRVTDYVDPLIMFASFRQGSPYFSDQPSGEEKNEFERLYQRAADAKTLDERYETVRALSQFVNEQAIAVALFEERRIYYLRRTSIADLGDQPAPLTLFIQNIRLPR